MISRHAAIAIPEIVPKETWDLEFGVRQAIPSSTRVEPAKALTLFTEVLGLNAPMKVLDAGCGNGRNAVYLAKRGCHVTAVDFANFPIDETRRRVVEAGLSHSVSVVRHSLADSVPFPDESFDFVLDSYVFCHFLRDEIGQRFWHEMARTTKPGGCLLSVVFSRDDEYYASIRKNNDDLVCDPANGIWKRLYSEREIKGFFYRQFELKYFSRFEFSDIVLGSNYRRIVLISVLRKSS